MSKIVVRNFERRDRPKNLPSCFPPCGMVEKTPGCLKFLESFPTKNVLDLTGRNRVGAVDVSEQVGRVLHPDSGCVSLRRHLSSLGVKPLLHCLVLLGFSLSFGKICQLTRACFLAGKKVTKKIADSWNPITSFTLFSLKELGNPIATKKHKEAQKPPTILVPFRAALWPSQTFQRLRSFPDISRQTGPDASVEIRMER